MIEGEQDSSDRIGLRVTAMSAMGSRKYMEDTFSVAYQKADNGNDLDYAYFGMFDGHGGDTASIFAKNHLMNYIVDEADFWSDNDQDVVKAIKKGFLECHLAMWKDLDKWPTTSSGLPSTAGTTASVAFLRKGKLYIGHCGDSGIVLGRTDSRGKWIAQPLTTEHKPESPSELSRIESFGGKVQQKQGIHRVVWYRPKNPHQGPIRRNTRIEEVPFLAVARSLGDLWSYNYKTQKFVVSPEPDVHIIDVDITSFKCLIFASDGLWNVIDSELAVNTVFDTEQRNDHNARLGINSWYNPSKILVETALERWRSNGLRADNTSVVCVMLDSPNKRNMFKFCRPPTVNLQPIDAPRTIFDYSTSEAYNLDSVNSDVYGSPNLARQTLLHNITPQVPVLISTYSEPPTINSSCYLKSTTSFNASTSSSSSTTQKYSTESLTYHTTNNESAFVKACCRNNYLLARTNEYIPYHSSYEQHREMYENMAMRPYPPLHYAYRPVPAVPKHLLPSLHTNVYDHQGYLQNSHNYRPMERYNYLRPTPEEVAAMHNEEDEDNESNSDTNDMDLSDEESDAENDNKETEKVDDSVQIFEISSSSFNETTAKEGTDQQFKSTPAKSNNKENNEETERRKKVVAVTTRRFYATRQNDRKMRSGTVNSSKKIGKEKKLQKKSRTIRKATNDNKAAVGIKKVPMAPKKKGTESKISLIKEAIKQDSLMKPRVLRSADTICRKSRSSATAINVSEKPATRKRTSVLFDNIVRNKDQRLK